MKLICNTLVSVAILLLLSWSCQAASIGVNFLGDGGTPESRRLEPTDEAGVVAQLNWNNITTAGWGSGQAPTGGAVSDSLLDNAGNATAVQLHYTGNDAWNSSGTVDTPNDRLMKGILKEGTVGTSMSLIFLNLAAGSSYDVYIYGNVNGGPVDLDVSIGTVTNYWSEPSSYDEGTGFIEATGGTPDVRAEGNYARFSKVTPNDGKITITATYRGGSDGLGIAGLQLVAAAAFPSNAIPVAITQQPLPAVAAPGKPATFSVGVSGPGARFQWFRNNTLISGATNSSYSTPPVSAADNGAKFKVTVSNNVNSVTSDEVALSVVADPGTRAASIGVSFLGDGGTPEDRRLASTDTAGVLAQANWNNISTPGWGDGEAPAGGSISDPLLDSAGNLTAVQLHYAGNDAWNSDGTTDTPNDKLMKGIIKEGGAGSSMTLSFTNLAQAFYDVYVYGNVNGGPVDLDVSIGGTTYYWTEPASYDAATGFIQTSSTDPGLRAEGNYVKFTGLAPIGGSITVTATYRSGGDGLGIAGLQLASSAAFPSNTTPVAIMLQPQSTLAAPGKTAGFSVEVSGPGARFQWFKNSAPISGATNNSYTTPAVTVADTGTKYKVTISNNVNSVTSTEATLTVMDDPGTRVGLIGVSFLGDGGTVNDRLLAPTDLAGVVPQANWNNINSTASGNVGVSDRLLDSAGMTTAAQLEFVANDAWNSDGVTDTPNDKLMKGIIKEGGTGSSMTLSFRNLAAAFYDVYVYGNVNGGPVDLDVSVGGTIQYWTEPAAFDAGVGFVRASSTDPGVRAEGNYVKFTSVTPTSGTITVIATYQSGSDGLGIAGLQLISSASFQVSPTLTATRQGNEIVITWNTASGFQLQSKADLGQGTWTDETTPGVVNGNQTTVRLPATGLARFFRLVSR